jgi:hypothetical protein
MKLGWTVAVRVRIANPEGVCASAKETVEPSRKSFAGRVGGVVLLFREHSGMGTHSANLPAIAEFAIRAISIG